MLSRTKIVATLGPATDSPAMLDKIIEAGVDVVRLNFSHEAAEQQRQRVDLLRERAEAAGRSVGVLGDLQGPKIRIGGFAAGRVQLADGAAFVIDTGLDPEAGTGERVGTTYPALANDVGPGDTLLLDDGLISLRVEKVAGSAIHCRVLSGGELGSRKGLNRLGGGLAAAGLTDKDRADIRLAAEIGVDYLAVSFVREAADVVAARHHFVAAGGFGGLVAKIERAEALRGVEAIIDASDAIMIARGDLGVEIGDAALPPVQKRLIRLARERNRVVITATQMMHSMMDSPIPTRAEVFDVANAVLEGTDAVMLSAETATGRFPDRAVAAMNRICHQTERQADRLACPEPQDQTFSRIDEAIAKAAMFAANHLPVKAILALTESGSTALWMSRVNASIPIYALTPHPQTQRRVTLYRGVESVPFVSDTTDQTELNRQAVTALEVRGLIEPGDLVAITKGDLIGVRGSTNALKIVRVGELV
ncbi:MAG: pyruvate kinase [Thermodesulfobacteriota bacterium]